jgi:hypothetical protein
MSVRRSASRVQASNDGTVARVGRATEDATVVEMRVHLAGVKEALSDHETRLRELEAARAKLLGACLVLAALAGSASGWLALVVMHH